MRAQRRQEDLGPLEAARILVGADQARPNRRVAPDLSDDLRQLGKLRRVEGGGEAAVGVARRRLVSGTLDLISELKAVQGALLDEAALLAVLEQPAQRSRLADSKEDA